MKKLVINLGTALGGLVFSIYVGLQFHSAFFGFLTAMGVAIIRLLVDIRLHLQTSVSVEISFLNNYARLRESKCELFREAAVAKLKAVNSYFDDLASGNLSVENIQEVYDLLKLLFCDIQFVKEIHATSCDELSEWRDSEGWWGKRYLDIHKTAINRGVKIQRVFIARSEQELDDGRPIFRRNAEARVAVRVALRRLISESDFTIAGNCMLFFNRDRVPVYSLQAVHDGEGRFLSAIIHNEESHIKPVVDAYRHIEAVSLPFRD